MVVSILKTRGLRKEESLSKGRIAGVTDQRNRRVLRGQILTP